MYAKWRDKTKCDNVNHPDVSLCRSALLKIALCCWSAIWLRWIDDLSNDWIFRFKLVGPLLQGLLLTRWKVTNVAWGTLQIHLSETATSITTSEDWKEKGKERREKWKEFEITSETSSSQKNWQQQQMIRNSSSQLVGVIITSIRTWTKKKKRSNIWLSHPNNGMIKMLPT